MRKFGSMTEMEEFFRERGRAGGKLGGAKGGKTAAKNMTEAQRKARAKKAAFARWGKKKKSAKPKAKKVKK